MKKTILILSTAFLLFTGAFAQIGIIDPNFNVGTGFGPDQFSGRCETIVQQPDGKLLVGGFFTEYNGDIAVRLVRLNLDGTRDASFQTGAGFTGISAYVKAIAVQNDGKILVGGNFLEVNGVTRHRIARLNADGSLDTSFDPLTGFDSDVNTIQIQDDGKILVGGIFTKYDWLNSQGINRNCIARLNSNGSLDTSFDPGDGMNSTAGQTRVHEIIIQGDGKILACGLFTSFNNQPRNIVVRINSNGTIDPSFDASEDFIQVFGFFGEAWDMELLGNGKILLAGNFHYMSSGKGICRLNSDGSSDASFTSSSSGFTSIALQSDGKYIATTSGPYIVKRFNADGTQDMQFPETTLNDWAKKTIVQTDGNITLVGHFNYNPNSIMRIIGDTPMSAYSIENPAFGFNIYPNPSNGIVKFDFDNINRRSISFYNSQGQRIHRLEIMEKTLELDLKSWALASGLYFIEINDLVSNQRFSSKLIFNAQ
jgi:uncharacterized delta-60 repeat protein